MHRRRTGYYIKVLKAIKQEALLNDIELRPKTITTDFELAAINAFTSVYQEIQTKGCLFHLG